MTSRYITALVGHPNQIQPSHIVITSPYFDTREIHHQERRGSNTQQRLEHRRRVMMMRDHGVLFKDIGKALGVTTSAAHRMYKYYHRPIPTCL
jgi:hypothetical protein